MSLSISNQVIVGQLELNASVFESQLALSQSLRSFFKEATSGSSLFALGAGQSVALLVKSQSHKFLSFFCKSTSYRLPIYHYLSSTLALIAEGISFPIASQLGKREELSVGSFGENIHGVLTIALCKTIGKKFPINNYIFQHAIQDCAMITLDIGCERLNFIEQKSLGIGERMLEAEIASCRIETSAKLLAISCSHLSISQSKYELSDDIRKNLKIINRFIDTRSGKFFFVPEAVSCNGLLIKMSENNEARFSLHATDLMAMTTGERSGQKKGNTSEVKNIDQQPALESRRDEFISHEKRGYLELLPQTVRTRLKEVGEEDSRLASFLIDTWSSICDDPKSSEKIWDRSILIARHEMVLRDYLRKSGSYSDEHVKILIEFSFKIFFEKVPEEEFFYVREVTQPTSSKKTKEVAYNKLFSTTSSFSDHQNKKKEKPPIDLKRVEAIKEYLTFPAFLQKRIAESERGIDPTSPLYILAASIVKSGKRSIDVRAPHQKTKNWPKLDRAMREFAADQKVYSTDPAIAEAIKQYIAFPLYIQKMIIESAEGVDPVNPLYALVENISKLDFSAPLKKRIAESPRGIDPTSALYILSTSVANSGKNLMELKALMQGEIDRVLDILAADPNKTSSPIGIELIARIKAVFDDLKVEFDGALFCRDYYPNLKLFPAISNDIPCIEMTENQWKQAHHFNLGGKLLAHRFNSQTAKREPLGKQIAKKLGVSLGTLQRYEKNQIHIVKDDVLMRAIDDLLNLPQEKREIAYLASRPALAQVIPIYIKGEDGKRVRRLSSFEIHKFRQQRAEYLNADPLRDEVAKALLEKGINGQKEFAAYLKKHGGSPAKAKKFMEVGDQFTDEEIRMVTTCLGLSYKKWRRHFDKAVDSYFLGVDEDGNILYPTLEDFKKLDKIPPAPPALIAEKYPKATSWNDLTTEQKWHLYILRRLVEPFGNLADQFRILEIAAKKTGITNIKFHVRLKNGIIQRSWPNETLAKFLNGCEWSDEDRALLYMYFRKESLLNKI